MTTPMQPPSLDIRRWGEIDATMQGYLDSLKQTVKNACDSDWNWFNRTMDFLMPGMIGGGGIIAGLMGAGRDALVRLGADLIPGADVIFPQFTMPDGTTREIVSPGDLVRAGQDMYHCYEGIAKDLANQIEGVWNNTYKPVSSAPKKLYDVSEQWRGIGEAIQALPEEISRVQQIAGWQGAGADAYRRIVPHQSAATSSTGTMVQGSSSVMSNASQGLQSLYLSFAAQLQQAQGLIESYDPGQDGQSFQWAYNTSPRARYSTSVLEDTLDFLENTLPGHETNWSSSIDTASGTLTDHESLDTTVFVDGAWPPSEGDKLGDIEPGAGAPSTGYPGADYSPPQSSSPTAPQEPPMTTPAAPTDTSSNQNFSANDERPDFGSFGW